MDDERSTQLAQDRWSVPRYAQSALWAQAEHGECVRAEGPQGLLSFSVPPSLLALRWGSAQGPILRLLSWQSDSLGWRGEVRIGGLIETIHYAAWDDGQLLACLSVSGQPLWPRVAPFWGAGQRSAPQPMPDFYEGFPQEEDFQMTTWLVPGESPFLPTLETALGQQTPLYLFGRLAQDATPWPAHFALPIILEAMTLFSR
ncbi:MAG: hypothetical protein NZ750_09720 [Anaerolineae bacterium]|nr:hypothetical protein [Anaerolineae bacterium]MDW8171898.1 hypothetical protein [Anaerolineae bacterium]